MLSRILAAAAASLCLAGCVSVDPITRTADDIGADASTADGHRLAGLCTVAKIAQGLQGVELTAEERALIIPRLEAAALGFAQPEAEGLRLYEDDVYEAQAQLAGAFGDGLARRAADLLAGAPGAANIVSEAVAYAGGARAVERGCARLIDEGDADGVIGVLLREIQADLERL